MNRLNSYLNATHATTLSTRARSHLGLLWLLALPFCAALANSAQAAIPASESTALVALYNNTGGANWTDLDGWLGAPGTECSWYGITCDQAQTHVTSLDVEVNNLVGGPIPALTGLADLQTFDVGSNQLSGPVPSLAGLPGLQSFAVDGNQLSGDVPDAPSPNNLLDGQSLLCPNRLNLTTNADWGHATGATPWYAACDVIFVDGFDGGVNRP